MPTYNNTRSNDAEADFGLAEYGIIRQAARKVVGRSKDFFAIEQEGPGEGATIITGDVEDVGEYGQTLYQMAPDDNSSMNMLHRQALSKPFQGMTEDQLRQAIRSILDSV